MIKVNPLSGEDRAKIIDYCEGHRAHVVNERDVDDCVVIDIERDSIQGAALLTGLKTNAKAKFKVIKESIFAHLLALAILNEAKLDEAINSQVKNMSAVEILDKADLCPTADNLTQLLKSKKLEIEEITSSDNRTVATVSGWHRGSKHTATVVFDGLDVISCDVEKDTGGKKEFRR